MNGQEAEGYVGGDGCDMRSVSAANDGPTDHLGPDWDAARPLRRGAIAVMPCIRCLAGMFAITLAVELVQMGWWP